MANGEITLLNVNNVTYQGSSTLSCGPLGVIQIKPEFCIGDNGDTTRQPDLSFHMNYVSGKWCAGAVNDWIVNESPSTVNELNFRDSSFPLTKPSNIQFTDGTNGQHLSNGVSWLTDAVDTQYTTYVERLGVGTGTTIYESSTNTTYLTNNNRTHILFKPDCCTSLYFCGSERACTVKLGFCAGTLLTCLTRLGSAEVKWCDTGGDLYLNNTDPTSASDIFIKPIAGKTIAYYCNALKFCTINTGICVIGTVSSSSDERIKNIVGDIDDPLEIVNNLCAKKFTSKLTDDNCVHLGYIAQEVQSVLPEVVNQPDADDNKPETEIAQIYKSLGIEDGVYGISYTEIIPVLSEAIKIQQTCINNLEERITTLENK